MSKILTVKNQSLETGAKKRAASRSSTQKPLENDQYLDQHGFAAPGSPGQIIRLQSMVGNRAVQRMLGQPINLAAGQPSLVQRWGGQEHADIANVTGIQIDLGNGVILDWGEVTSIAGDEVGTLDELLEWVKTETGKAKIRAALENAEVAGNGVKTLPAPFADEKKEQKERFYTLLLDNTTHFQSGGQALDMYRTYHFRALDTALRAGIQSPDKNSPEINQAYVAEAFGQHFLTDMFSGGHAVTPRSEIYDYYVNTWAPTVVDSLLANLKTRLANGIFDQIGAQSGVTVSFPGTVRNKISNALDDMLNQSLAKLKGGKAELTSMLGKGIAGVISGAIHDFYNANGVWVSSESHPETWLAMGDSHLNDTEDEINRKQAELAVQAGLADVQLAFEMGQREGNLKQSVPPPDKLPNQVYFKFNSADIQSQALESLDKAAAFLAYNPDYHLDLIGHTDPIGSFDFNDGLGMRRADSIVANIMGHAVESTRMTPSSQGKKELVTKNPKQYNLNRRVEFHWTNEFANQLFLFDRDEIAHQRASDALTALVGPPYHNVESFIPQVVPGLNPQMPDWHWENMPPSLLQMIDDWVRSRFDKDLQTQVLSSDMLNKRDVEGFEIDPRSIVEDFIKEINDSPTNFLHLLFLNPNDPRILTIDINNLVIQK